MTHAFSRSTSPLTLPLSPASGGSASTSPAAGRAGFGAGGGVPAAATGRARAGLAPGPSAGAAGRAGRRSSMPSGGAATVAWVRAFDEASGEFYCTTNCVLHSVAELTVTRSLLLSFCLSICLSLSLSLSLFPSLRLKLSLVVSPADFNTITGIVQWDPPPVGMAVMTATDFMTAPDSMLAGPTGSPLGEALFEAPPPLPDGEYSSADDDDDDDDDDAYDSDASSPAHMSGMTARPSGFAKAKKGTLAPARRPVRSAPAWNLGGALPARRPGTASLRLPPPPPLSAAGGAAMAPASARGLGLDGGRVRVPFSDTSRKHADVGRSLLLSALFPRDTVAPSRRAGAGAGAGAGAPTVPPPAPSPSWSPRAPASAAPSGGMRHPALAAVQESSALPPSRGAVRSVDVGAIQALRRRM